MKCKNCYPPRKTRHYVAAKLAILDYSTDCPEGALKMIEEGTNLLKHAMEVFESYTDEELDRVGRLSSEALLNKGFTLEYLSDYINDRL